MGRARLIHEPADDFSQSLWVSRMARLAVTEHGADWVMHCDADEFWWADGMALKPAFDAIDTAYGIVWAKRHEFLPCDLRGQPFWKRMVISDTQPLNALGRPLLPKCAHRADPDVVVCQGNHDVVSSTLAPLRNHWQPRSCTSPCAVSSSSSARSSWAAGPMQGIASCR